jgi:hypothetical protein
MAFGVVPESKHFGILLLFISGLSDQNFGHLKHTPPYILPKVPNKADFCWKNFRRYCPIPVHDLSRPKKIIRKDVIF